LEQLISLYTDHGFDDIKLVIATRDKSISAQSKAWNHQSNSRIANLEQRLAELQLANALRNPPIPVYIFSYESYMLLGQTYLVPLLTFLKKPVSWIDTMETEMVTDGNSKHVQGTTLITGLIQIPKAFFFARQSAVMSRKEALRAPEGDDGSNEAGAGERPRLRATG
jgi:hypothetical protein